MCAPGRTLLLATMLLVIGCADRGADGAPRDSGEQSAEANGRTYTQWFYERDFDQLWGRFSPEMKRTFASAGDLARFAGQTVDELGTERAGAEERVVRQDSLMVYSRLASFEPAGDRMLLEWTLAEDGMVTGFVFRPAPGDSLPAS